jgi:hypothetical protein
VTLEPHDSANRRPGANELNHLRETLFQECARLAKKYGLCRLNGEPKISTVLSQIASSSRLCCVARDLRKSTRGKIDPYYLSKHDFAVNLIAEALDDRLSSINYKIRVETEVLSRPGRYDITLEPYEETTELPNSSRKIGIEVKTGLSIDVAQLIRYIIDVDTLILARTQPKQVAVIRQQELIAPLSAIIVIWISRIRRLLANSVPTCPHEKDNGPQYFLSGKALESDILTFSRTLPDVVNSILECAVVELRISGLVT